MGGARLLTIIYKVQGSKSEESRSGYKVYTLREKLLGIKASFPKHQAQGVLGITPHRRRVASHKLQSILATVFSYNLFCPLNEYCNINICSHQYMPSILVLYFCDLVI